MFKLKNGNKIYSVLVIFLLMSLTSCAVMNTTGRVAKTVGCLGWEVTKVTSKAAWWVTKQTYRGVRTVVYMSRGKEIIPLEERGGNYYAKVVLNGKVKATLIVDTGASNVQISRRLADKLKLRLNESSQTLVKLAGGSLAMGRLVELKEVRIGRVRVKHVAGLVLEHDSGDDGLLGMSFLEHFNFQIDTSTAELILQQRVVD